MRLKRDGDRYFLAAVGVGSGVHRFAQAHHAVNQLRRVGANLAACRSLEDDRDVRIDPPVTLSVGPIAGASGE